MDKKIKILLFCILAISACNERKQKVSNLEFVQDKYNCDSQGLPLDSSSNFFPKKLFYDTIPAIKNGHSVYELYYVKSKEEYAKIPNLNISTLKDTFLIAKDTFFLNFYSYALYKMHEPILYDHFLLKEIYRLIAFRSMNSPLVVRLEKGRTNITMIIKKLNKSVRFPIMRYIEPPDSIFDTTPDIAYFDTTSNHIIVLDTIKFNQQYIENKRYHDSLAKDYNVIDYYLKIDTIIKVPLSVWNHIQVMVDSTEFWTAKPNVAPGYVQIDCLFRTN